MPKKKDIKEKLIDSNIKKRRYFLIGITLVIIVLIIIANSFVSVDAKESNFTYNRKVYDCSKEIEGTWVPDNSELSTFGRKKFIPDSQDELNKFCRPIETLLPDDINVIIEYHAVIDVLKMPDVDAVISKYPTTEAWVKVLNYSYIQDEEYVDRILPGYSDIEIECIVAVHSPEGTRFFLEKAEEEAHGHKHEYLEVDSEEFLKSLNNASDEDVNSFWLSLR